MGSTRKDALVSLPVLLRYEVGVCGKPDVSFVVGGRGHLLSARGNDSRCNGGSNAARCAQRYSYAPAYGMFTDSQSRQA
jgi:hypothetical protein